MTAVTRTAEFYLAIAAAAEGAPPEDFTSFAIRIQTSRPYVSGLVNKSGRIHGEALAQAAGKTLIVPTIAARQLAASSATASSAAADTPIKESAYVGERTRKLVADRELTELQLARERGRLVERAIAGPAIAGFFRTVRDGVILAIREHPDRPEDAVQDFFADQSAKLAHVLPAGDTAPG